MLIAVLANFHFQFALDLNINAIRFNIYQFQYHWISALQTLELSLEEVVHIR